MQRMPFILAVANNIGMTVINAIDNLTFTPGGTCPLIPYHRLTYFQNGNDYHFLIHKIADGLTLPFTSAGLNGKWEAWLILPESSDWRVGPVAYRKLRRAVLSDRNTNAQGETYLKGPWSIAAIAAAYPAFATQYLTSPLGGLLCPHVIFGDPSPEQMAVPDYSPTDEDCSNDVEPEEGSLYWEM